MKTTNVIAGCLLFVAIATIQDAQAQGGRGGNGRGPWAGNTAQAAGVQHENGMGANAGERPNNMGQQQACMQQTQNAGVMTQQLLANFDQDGNGELNPSELEQALFAVMQRVQQQMQMNQRMTMQGMGGGMGQGISQQNSRVGQNLMGAGTGNRQGNTQSVTRGQRGGRPGR